MKALVKTRPGPGAVLQEMSVPVPGPNDLLVKVKATALCKSDLDVIEWSPLVASSNLPLPLIMGHEFFGEVCEVGKLVKNFKVGEYITGETHIPRTARKALRLIGCDGYGSNIDDNKSVLRLAEIAAATVTALDLNTACSQAAAYEMAESHVRLARGEKA